MSGIWSLYNQGGSGGPPPPQLRGRLVYVDSRYGNNSTGLVERADRPFATIEAAFNAALAAATELNDPYTIHVRPGRYLLTPNQMVKPANRTIHFEFENEVQLIVDSAFNPFPPNSAWLEILGGPVIMNGWGSLNIVATLSQESCLFRLNGNDSGNSAFLNLYANQIWAAYSGPNASFIRCVATGPASSAVVHSDFIGNITSSEGQAFIRWDGTAAFNGAEVYVYSNSRGFRMFYDGPSTPLQHHRFFSRRHHGSIGGLTATDGPVTLEILDGTLITKANMPPLPPPLGLRPQSIRLGGAINVCSDTTFIPDVINGIGWGYGGPHVFGSVQFGGWTSPSQPYTNQFSFQGGYLDADYHANFFGSIPPGGASPPVGYFIRHQLIKSFFVKGDAGYIGGSGNVAFGTVNLGILTPYVPANSITQNGRSIPLLSAPAGAMITAPSDQLRIFADPANTSNVVVNGHLIIVAELGKAM